MNISGARVRQPESDEVSQEIDEKEGTHDHVKDIRITRIRVQRRQDNLKCLTNCVELSVKFSDYQHEDH